jgi:Glu-tRNA(Gln) amidotransferase subunit E-like FAD-binding protein
LDFVKNNGRKSSLASHWGLFGLFRLSRRRPLHGQVGFLQQVTDTGAIEAAVDEIIAANPDKVEQAKAKPTMLGWFVGQVMKQTGGKANPQSVNDLLKRKLGI